MDETSPTKVTRPSIKFVLLDNHHDFDNSLLPTHKAILSISRSLSGFGVFSSFFETVNSFQLCGIYLHSFIVIININTRKYHYE